MKWLLDTDTCIALIKGTSESAEKLFHGKSIGQVGISSITLGELQYGIAKSARPAEAAVALGQFILPLEVAAFDANVAEHYGGVRAALERMGRPIGPLDTLIAAHALTLDVVLVTHNTREFGRIKGLRVEDWITR